MPQRPLRGPKGTHLCASPQPSGQRMRPRKRVTLTVQWHRFPRPTAFPLPRLARVDPATPFTNAGHAGSPTSAQGRPSPCSFKRSVVHRDMHMLHYTYHTGTQRAVFWTSGKQFKASLMYLLRFKRVCHGIDTSDVGKAQAALHSVNQHSHQSDFKRFSSCFAKMRLT